MSKRKQRHMSPAGFLLALVLLIVGIFALDAFYRVFLQNVPENIVGVGGFASTPSASDTSSAGEENADTTEATQPSGTVLQLTAADEANGSLILVDAAHPYAGAQAWTDFSAVTDTNVKPRDTSLQMQSEITEPLCSLFDAYAAANGYANLQVYSTLDTTLSSTSIYTNVLPDRSSGYGFDIGLITSTGEVVPYITKLVGIRLHSAVSQRQDRNHRHTLRPAPLPVCGQDSRGDHARKQLLSGGIPGLSPELHHGIRRAGIF